MQMENCTTLIAKADDFSSETGLGKKTCHREKGKIFPPHTTTIYCNGYKEDNKGYVSIRIEKYGIGKTFDGLCIISLIDVAGNRCFTQTFECAPNQSTGRYVYIDNYIARETLLRNPDEYLPNNTLTLQIEMCPAHDEVPNNDVANKSKIISLLNSAINQYLVKIGSEFSKIHYYSLQLDSHLAQRLSEESTYFKGLLDTPMIEGKTREMYIPPEEFQAFLYIGRILLDANPLIYNRVGDIVNMYRVADKYDIPVVILTCKCFLKLYFSEHSEYLRYDEESDNLTTEKDIEVLKELPVRLKEDSEDESKYGEILQKQKPSNREECFCSDAVSSHLSNEKRSELLEETEGNDDIKAELLRVFLLRSIAERPYGKKNLISPVLNEILAELSEEIKCYLETEDIEMVHVRKQQIGNYEWIYKRYKFPGKLCFEKVMEGTADEEVFDFYN